MSRSVIAVYSGTFDPITLGHEDVVFLSLIHISEPTRR
jgi:phosphopantetheine adenylyltransferase